MTRAEELARGVVAEVGGKNRAENLEAPFVGRDDDRQDTHTLLPARWGGRRGARADSERGQRPTRLDALLGTV